MNRQQFFIKTWLSVLFLVSAGLVPTEVRGEEIVIGGGPGTLDWEQQFSEISVIDFAANPGQIQPDQTGSADNLALKILESGGSITSPNARIVLEISTSELDNRLKSMISGDTTDAFEIKGVNATGIIINIDMGERFGINRIRFGTRTGFEEFAIGGFSIFLNDGTQEQTTLAGTPDFRLFKTIERNVDPVIDLDVPLQFVRFIQLKQLVRGEWEIDEFEVFGEGFVSAASYTSKVFDQVQDAVFGGLTWSAGAIGEPTKSSVVLSTRSGTSADPSDTLAWSPWSPPLPAGVRTDIVSPAPRRYFQFRFLFESSDILSAATVDSLVFEVSPAIADSLQGEISPQNAFIGQNTTFTYAVRSFDSNGFDRLKIETLAPVDVVHSVEIDGVEVPFEKTDLDDGVEIGFERIVGNKTLQVVFDNIALQYNTVFSGKVSDSQRLDRLPQSIGAGDVIPGPLAAGDDLSVTILVGKDLIHSMEIAPNPFTPNGDAVNDELQVTYDFINLTDVAPVSVRVYDLSGRLVKDIYSGLDSSRRYQRTWDGTNNGGDRVAPGIYLVRVEVDTDAGTKSRTAVVSLVY